VLLAATPAWLGSVPTWALFALGVLFAYRISKGGGGSAVSELSKANEVLTAALERERHERREERDRLGAEIRDAKVELGHLAGRTDFTAALAAALGPVIEWTSGHEQRAQERHDAVMRAGESQLKVLDLIAKALGPERDKWNGEERREPAGE
jgi:hypothetical protein